MIERVDKVVCIKEGPLKAKNRTWTLLRVYEVVKSYLKGSYSGSSKHPYYYDVTTNQGDTVPVAEDIFRRHFEPISQHTPIDPAKVYKGMPLIYIPDHAGGMAWHEDSEAGFFVKMAPSGQAAFCRFFYKSHVDYPAHMTLRTTANSESAQLRNLYQMNTVPIAEIERAMEFIKLREGFV